MMWNIHMFIYKPFSQELIKYINIRLPGKKLGRKAGDRNADKSVTELRCADGSKEQRTEGTKLAHVRNLGCGSV